MNFNKDIFDKNINITINGIEKQNNKINIASDAQSHDLKILPVPLFIDQKKLSFNSSSLSANLNKDENNKDENNKDIHFDHKNEIKSLHILNKNIPFNESTENKNKNNIDIKKYISLFSDIKELLNDDQKFFDLAFRAKSNFDQNFPNIDIYQSIVLDNYR